MEKAKTITNFWKPIPTQDLPYYDKRVNVIITAPGIREIIVFLKELGLNWFVSNSDNFSEEFRIRYDLIYASWQPSYGLL